MITIFTTTYNRAHLLPDLYKSLCEQTSKDFEWIVIDDGSTDETKNLLQKWSELNNLFPIKIVISNNKGKCLQINEGVKIACGEYFFIVDSDDYLTTNAIELLEKWILGIKDNITLAGVSGLRINPDRSYIKDKEPRIPCPPGYIDASVYERKLYSLDVDMAECYSTSILRKYPFRVWPGETFASEGQVWNAIADDGYKIRWYKTPIMIVRYQEDGLTNGFWKLLQNNPMAFATMFSNKFHHEASFKGKIFAACECISCLSLAGNLFLLHQFLTWRYGLIFLPAGVLLSYRRCRQIKEAITKVEHE